MLSSASPKKVLLACPRWNLPSFTVESTFSSPYSRSDPPHSRQGAALAHLDSLPLHDLLLWTDGSVPFPFGKGGSGVFANCSRCGTEATLYLWKAQNAQVFWLKPAPFCTLFAGLGSTNKSVISLLLSDFSFCPRHPVLSSIFPLISNSLAGIVFYVLLFYQATMGPRTLVSPGERRG